MSRISNSTFKVNESLEQMMELSAVKSGVTVPISTSSELDVNLTQVAGSAVALGETTASASIPVVLANDVEASVSLDAIGASAKGADSTLASALQVGTYGWDGSNWRQMNVSNGGNLKVESELEDHAGSQGNLENAGEVVDGDTSTAIDTSNHTLLTCFGNTTDTANAITPQISADGTNYYPLDFDIYPNADGDFYQSFPNITVNNFRLKFNGTATVTATLLHNNH
tara:strand:- start:1674 stop:2351 length:678 start_codon:yes stop_codon:yes gene_type:complete